MHSDVMPDRRVACFRTVQSNQCDSPRVSGGMIAWMELSQLANDTTNAETSTSPVQKDGARTRLCSHAAANPWLTDAAELGEDTPV